MYVDMQLCMYVNCIQVAHVLITQTIAAENYIWLNSYIELSLSTVIGIDTFYASYSIALITLHLKLMFIIQNEVLYFQKLNLLIYHSLYCNDAT